MKITTLFLAFTLSTGATTAFSQTQGTQLQQPQQQETKVSDGELEKFASIYTKVQAKNQKLQQEAAMIIKEEGMELERFNKIAQAQNNPNSEVEPTKKETTKIAKINTEIQKMQTTFQGQVTTMIQKEGLTVKRYQEVYAALQQDKSLQQKFGELIQG